MVYFYTSQNVKMMRNLLLDFQSVEYVSAYEYIQSYIEKCPESIEDTKIAWITETFLGIQKHEVFLTEIAANVSEAFTDEEQDCFLIILYGLIFQVQPKDMELLYKCLYNLSKPLLTTFTKFLSNNEVLTYIAQVGASSYDASYLTDKIISPLFVWQPYIGEIGNTYAEYLRKIEQRKRRRPTVPITPKVLSHKPKPISLPEEASCWSLPVPPPISTSIPIKKKLICKSAVDRKLRNEHEKNKQKAAELLNSAKNNTAHYAQDKSEKFKKQVAGLREQIENANKPMRSIIKKKTFSKAPVMTVKDTAANLKRVNRRIQNEEKDELQWFESIMRNFTNNLKFYDEFEEQERQEQARERLFDIEKKHLLVQLSFEEAVIAKKKLQEQNKKKGEEFLKEKEAWYEEIENWKKKQVEQQRKQVEKLSLAELSLSEAKTNMTLKKKEDVDKFKKQLKDLREKALRARNEQLESRIQMIKEIKLLALVARKAKVPKILDMTETPGLGLLCEMSMAELQERLSTMKISIQEEIEAKRKSVREEKIAAQNDLEETKKNIQTYLADKARQRKDANKMLQTKFTTSTEDLKTPSLKEINKLQKILEEKRSLRKRMNQ